MQSSGSVILRADIRGVVEEAYLTSELFLGPKILPPLPVTAKAGQYPYISITSGALLRDEVKARGPGGNYARLDRKYITGNYTCEEYGIEVPVDDSQAMDVSRFFNLESTETRLALRQVQLAHERRTASAIIDQSVFGVTTSAVSYGSGASSLANMDIGLDVDTAKQSIQGRGESTEGLSLVMSLNVFIRARTSTKLQNRIRGTISTDSLLVLDAQSMAAALGVKEVLIGRAYYDTSKTGASTASLSAIWGDTYMWLGRSITGGATEQYFNGSTGFTLYWNEDSSIFQVESYREDAIRSTIIRARHNVTEKIVNPRTAQLIATQYGA
jgi:hypothetical protein